MTVDKIQRVALYVRVSTEEQAQHGYSLEEQEGALTEYAADKNFKVVGIYRDEGFSARKPAMKRKAIQRLLADVEADKIDLILFTKLDRWFRNVSEYHKVQAVLDAHNVTWRAILEDYQTETADGRFKVNIMLSVAENEADRTSERISFIFDRKVKRGEYVYGGKYTPFGYKIAVIDGVRRLVKDEATEDAVNAFWEKMRKYDNVRRAGRETNLEFGLHRAHKSWMAYVRNETATGTFHGVPGFCPAYISHKEWERYQHPENRVKSTQHNRVYLFAGLLICPVCGHTLKSNYKTYPNDRTKEYYGYRCNARELGYCLYKGYVSERKVEKLLLSSIQSHLDDAVLKYQVSKKSTQNNKKADVPKLKERLRRLNIIYMGGNMSDDEYNAQAIELRTAISKAEESLAFDNTPQKLEEIKTMLSGDFESVYNTFTRDEKQRFWRAIIKKVKFKSNGNPYEIESIEFNV